MVLCYSKYQYQQTKKVKVEEKLLFYEGTTDPAFIYQDKEDGFGFKFAMKTLAGGRIGIASQALGIASGAFELALDYSKQRTAFGKEISKPCRFGEVFQLVF